MRTQVGISKGTAKLGGRKGGGERGAVGTMVMMMFMNECKVNDGLVERTHD